MTEKITEQIFQVIREYHMIMPGMRVIAGVSGGADSVCLLDVLERYRQKIPFELLVVHVEHGLRGQESLEDAAFVETLCEAYAIPCRVAEARVHERMREEGLSCEEAGRAERYRIFEEIAGEWGADRIAVAHNQNDQAETVLWNLARGSGLKGLGGIRPVQGKIIRPLLFTGRDEIEAYLCSQDRSWRTDRTNLGTDYTRNRIRLSLLPQMETDLNHQTVRHVAEAAGRLQAVQEYLDKKTDEAAERCLIRKNAAHAGAVMIPEIERSCEEDFDVRAEESLDTSVLLLLDSYKKEEKIIREELLKRALRMCGGMKDVGAVHLRMLEQLTDMDCGKSCSLPGGIRVVREDGILRFLRAGKPDLPERSSAGEGKNAKQNTDRNRTSQILRACVPVILPMPGSVCYGNICVTTELMANTPDMKKSFLAEKKYTKWISYDTIKGKLQLRTRQTGDYLVVNAQGGTRKLKDYFIDQKIPRSRRDQVLLLADGSHILWVVGYRISEAAKVTEATETVVRIQIHAIQTVNENSENMENIEGEHL
ncbi:MAG: tRNA lysidine(34) synthetase TilS [Clostridiales bacterium]|nr:tRNA lysidine(34) synthetase TilS [Clostridiales bacterium]